MSTADDRDGRKSKRSSHRRRRTPSPVESDSYDSYSSDSSPERAPRRSKTAPVAAAPSRGYNSDDGSYRSSRRTDGKSSRRSTRDKEQTSGTVIRNKGDRTTRVERGTDGGVYAERSDRDRDSRRRSRRDRERDRDDYDSSSRSPSPQRKKGLVDDIMASFGLVGKQSSSRAGGSRDDRDDRDDRDRRGTSHRRDRDDRDDGERQEQKAQALKAALTAAAVEAWRTRKIKSLTPTERMMRIASAAVAAGGLDAMIDRNPDSNGLRHIAEAVVGGLVTSKSVGGNLERKDGFRNKIMDSVIGKSAASAHSMYASRSNGPGSGNPRHKSGSSSRRARSR